MSNQVPMSIPQLLVEWSERAPERIALLAPGRPSLTYGRLRRQMDTVVQTLRAMGLHRHDRVALVLPNGPELAVALLTVAAGAICVPINPNYNADEYAFHLTHLHVRLLIIQAGMDSPARVVARTYNIRVIELFTMQEAEAGLFTLTGTSLPSAGMPVYAQPNDVAVVMHTSGTTSRPKIIPRTHANIYTGADHMRTAVALDAHDRYLNVMPLFYGSGLVLGLLASLMAGASVVCLPGFDASLFFSWLADFHPTWYMGVSTIHQALLAQAPLHREIIDRYPLRFIRAGAAALPRRVQSELERTFNVPVISAYAMTEASLITCNPLPPRQRKPGSVGVAAWQEVTVMNAEGALLPAGESGEIVVRGPSVIKSYDNDPTANREAFKDGWFRTGDQGFFDEDGYLFITGRLKEIINRGGAKISPQEVDNILIKHPSVAQAATFSVPHVRWGEDVVSAVVLYPNALTTTQELCRFVAKRLADFKVPSQVLIVERIPIGSTGKLQRHRLAEQLGLTTPMFTPVQPVSNTVDIIPPTPLEEVLAGLWATVLDINHVDVDDNFFHLGGDSLVALQLLSRIRDVTHVELSFYSFFDTPTVAHIARHITTVRQAGLQRRELPLNVAPRNVPLPLSYGQQRLWFLDQLGLSRHAYNLLDAKRLYGPLQVAALEQSFREIIKRHEVLRTTFAHMAGEPLQIIGQEPQLTVAVEDLRRISQHAQDAQIYILAQTAVRQPFDLTHGPLMRVMLLQLTDIEHVLLLTMHHMVSDGWSHGLFWRELASLYTALTTAQPSRLSPLTMQYADFAYWQQQWRHKEVMDIQLTYWKRQLTGVTTLQLPTDHPRPAVQTFQGARQFLTLPSALTQAIKILSQRHGATLFMTLLAAFQTLLHRYTGQDDIVVGSLTANRNRIEFENLIGYFVNTLVLRTDLSGNPSFQDLLVRVREVTLGAYEHQDIPYEKLLEELRPSRELSRNSIFQVMCVLHNTPQQVVELPGLTVHPLEIDPGTARFDITLDFWEMPEGLRGRFEYSTDLFEATTMTRMAGHLQSLLEGIVATPEQCISHLPLLAADERNRMLVQWNSTTAPYPNDQCLHNLFEAQVTRTPDATALVCGDTSLTYYELNRRANQVAHYLLALGVGPEMVVGLCIERSLTMVVGLLGILKAGAAYLPLDPTYPPERLAFMLDDAQPAVLLTQEQLTTELPDHRAQQVCLDTHWPVMAQYPVDNPVSRATAYNIAYLLYTSGSTGRPKGVLGVHCAVLSALDWMWQAYPFTTHEVCCQKTSISFGDSIQELLGPLLRGIRIVLIPDEELKDLPRFVQALALHRVTRLILVPSLLRILLDTCGDLQDRLPSLQLWFAGGEALPSDLQKRFEECLPHGRLINLYGTSEASDDTTWCDTRLAANEIAYMPIGRPIANTQVYVLDGHLQPVPIGVPGELYIGGAGLTRGYLNRPALTAERFIPHPFSRECGARLYKTGDIVRYRLDGNIEYVARSDHQVKLRGIRIELGEIEATLAQHPDVTAAAVLIREDIAGEPRLVAYLVLAQASGPLVIELRHFLANRLPAAMVPTTFVRLETLPLTPSGKVDRRALPKPSSLRPVLEDLYIAPQSPMEQQVAGIWCDLLGLDQIGIHDNFFELGGHSLLAMRLLFRVRDAVHVEVSLLGFFEMPTVAGMVGMIETANQTDRKQQTPVIVPISREGILPASIAQEHFWLFEQILPELSLFNISYAVRLHGPLNLSALERSFNEIISRHEILRTTFTTADGQLEQVIIPTSSISLSVIDLHVLSESERGSKARQLIQEEGQRPFDLSQGPLLRSCLLRLSDQEYILLVTLHHIICDGWSLGVFVHELAILYDTFTVGEPSPLPALPIQYVDFVSWQRQWHHHASMQAQLAYWRVQLQAPLAVLELPTDRPRGTDLAWQTARQTFELPSSLFEALKGLRQREHSTLFTICLTAFKTLLYGYTGQEDLCMATLVANRARRETEALIGLLVNTVLLRTDLSGNPSLRDVLHRVRTTTLAAYANQELPFEEVVRALEQENDLQRISLCQVMVIWQNTMVQIQQLPKRTLCFEAIEQNMGLPNAAITTFDIILILRERPKGLSGMCIYKANLFNAETISQMFDDFQYVLECLSCQPEQTLASFRSLWEARG